MRIVEAPAKLPIYTIGHSNHTLEAFVSLLQEHGINEVADIRSAPYSRYTAHFNSDMLKVALDLSGIRYVFLGDVLGGRPVDPWYYDTSGRVHYGRVASSDQFVNGINDLILGTNERKIALMCTEKDPLNCHRALLVAPALLVYKTSVQHILSDGTLESHHAAMDRLMELLNLPPNGDLFRSRDEVINEALSRQARKVGHMSKVVVANEQYWRSSS